MSVDTVAHPEDHTLPTIYPLIRAKVPRGSTSITPQHEEQFAHHANRTLQRIGCHVFGSALLRDWRPTSDADAEEETDDQEAKDESLSSSSFDKQTPTSGPPEPGVDDLLNIGGGSRGGIPNSSLRPEPTQGPPEPDLDALMSIGIPKKQSTGANGITKGVPTIGPPEPRVDDLFNMGANSGSGGSIGKQPRNTPPQDGEPPRRPADSGTGNKSAEAQDEKDDAPKKQKGVGSLMKPTSNASQQGGQEFDMSSFGF